jgi:hypothetical protein
MSSKRSARALALMDSPVQDQTPMVEITFEIRTDTLAQIDALCEACKPVEVTREKMLRILVQTGLLYWESEPEGERAEDEAKPQKPSAATRAGGST